MIDDDDEIHARLSNGGRSYFDMNEAFCARMRKAIEAGLEKSADWYCHHTRNQKSQIVPAEPRPPTSSQRDMEHA
jgi:hypothetical protein